MSDKVIMTIVICVTILIISFKNVDFPDPDGPTRKTNSPFSIFKSILSNATTP